MKENQQKIRKHFQINYTDCTFYLLYILERAYWSVDDAHFNYKKLASRRKKNTRKMPTNSNTTISIGKHNSQENTRRTKYFFPTIFTYFLYFLVYIHTFTAQYTKKMKKKKKFMTGLAFLCVVNTDFLRLISIKCNTICICCLWQIERARARLSVI